MKKQILIGSLIGLLAFTLSSWVGNNTWNTLEMQLLEARSAIGLFNQFTKPVYKVISFDTDTKVKFNEKNIQEQKLFILDLINRLSKSNIEALYFYNSRNSLINLSYSDVKNTLSRFDIKGSLVNPKDVDRIIEDSGRTLLLSQKDNKLAYLPVADLLQDTIPKEVLRNSNIIVVAPDVNINTNTINSLINFIENRWINFKPISSFALFLLAVVSGISFSLLAPWARIIALTSASLLVLVFGQIVFAVTSIDMASVQLLSIFLTSFLITYLFDLQGQSQLLKGLQLNTSNTEDPRDQIKTLRTKFFHEQEVNFEDIAIELQQKTVQSINSIQEKLDALSESTELNNKDSARFTLIKLDLEQMMADLDGILFNLVPFRFEGEGGLLNLLELNANKIFMLSRGKVQILTESSLPSVQLDLNQKINTYRALQKIIELVLDENKQAQTSGFTINIKVSSEANAIKFRISYEGKAINQEIRGPNSHKLAEIYKRVNGIEQGELDLRASVLEELSSNTSHHIELKVAAKALANR